MFVRISGYGRGFGGTPSPRQFESFVDAIAAVDGKTVTVRDGAVWTFKSGGGNWYFARNCAHYPTTNEEIGALAQFAAADLAVAEVLFASRARVASQLPGLSRLLVATSEAIVGRAVAANMPRCARHTDPVLIVRAAIAVLCAASCMHSAVAPVEMLRAARAVGDPCADKVVDDYCALIYAPLTPIKSFCKIGLSRENLLVGLSQKIIDGEILPQSLYNP